MSKKKRDTINLTSSNSKRTHGLSAQSQTTQRLIAKELEESSYIKRIEELEKYGETLHKKIEEYPNMAEELRRILYHDVGAIMRVGTLKAYVKQFSKAEAEDLIMKMEKRKKKAKTIVVEYCQLYDDEIPELHPMDLQTTLNEIKEETSIDNYYIGHIRKSNITFKIDTPQKINFCIGATYGIFRNLINNAVKAIGEQQETIKKNNQSTQIHIFTRGKQIYFHNYGFIPEELQKERELFKIGTTTGKGGKGIGLYSAEQWIKKLGGSIDFTSSEQEGTTFIVTLPESLMIKE